MSDAITLDVLSSSPVQLDVGDADPIAREEIAKLTERVTTAEGDVSGLSTRVGAAEGDISTLGTTVDGIDARVEAIEADGSVTPAKLADTPFPSLLAGAAQSLTGDEPTEATFLDRACPGTTGQATVQSVRGNTVVQDGSLLPVRMEGIETVGFNQWDEEWEVGNLTADGVPTTATNTIRSKNFCKCLSSTSYYLRTSKTDGGNQNRYYLAIVFYDADKQFISRIWSNNQTVTSPDNAAYFKIVTNTSTVVYGPVYLNDVCINISDPSRNGTYEPYWRSERPIPASTYFPDGMRSAGTVSDELTNHEAIHRVGEVDLGTLTWTAEAAWQQSKGLTRLFAAISDAVTATTEDVKASAYFEPNATVVGSTMNAAYCMDLMNGRVYLTMPYPDISTAADFATWLNTHPVTLHYTLATPTTTPIDPPLNLTYRAEQGGTERITHTEQSAPPVLSIAYGHTAEGIVQEAASAIAAQDGPAATTNHAVGSYLTMGGTLYRVTTAIATGEAIVPGTNVMATTVMAEVLSLIQ